MSAMCCPVEMCPNSDCLQLTSREVEVCATVCLSTEPVPFSQIKNKLGYHQEIVSRILRRLVAYGAIEKSDGKYRRKVGQ